MKKHIKLKFALSTFILLLLIACSPLDENISEENWANSRSIIEADNSLHQMKREFLLKEIREFIKQNKLANNPKSISYNDLINELLQKFDSLNNRSHLIREQNALLDAVLKLEKAESLSLDQERGFIIFSLNFTKIFQDPIEFMILNYRYIDDYGEIYFSEKSKLSKQAAEDFDGPMQVIMTDIFNGENEFIYLNSNLSATEVLKEKYELAEIASSNSKEYLKEGLRIRISMIEFSDGTVLKRRNDDWPYYLHQGRN